MQALLGSNRLKTAEDCMIRARLALACSILLFAFVAAFIALPDMWLARTRLSVRNADEGQRRKAAAVRATLWGERLFRWICAVMRIRVRVELPARDDGRPAIIIANHTSTFDIIAVLGFAPLTGRHDIRWVMKREMLDAWIIGRMARWVGCIPVSRNRDPRDREAIDDGATLAGREGANPLIFPEGTRFDPTKVRDGYTRVLPPRRGGYDVLRVALPDYPVLDITFDWFPRLEFGAGKTMFSAADLYGRDLHIQARLVPPTELEHGDWLEEAFRRKDALLTDAASS